MRVRSIVVAMFVALCGCGDNVPGIPLDELYTESTSARCEHLVRCGLLADHATCTAFFRAPDDNELHTAIEAGLIHYDGASAKRCQEALAQLPCDQTSREARVLHEACARMFVGTIAVGDECLLDRECISGSCNQPLCPVDMCCPGTCLPTATSALGESCVLDEECLAETFCNNGVCSALAQKGQLCKLDTHCEYGHSCIGATQLQDGACRAAPLIGESCPYLRCAEVGAMCSASQICVAVGLPGAPCTTGAGCSPFTECGPAGLCIDVPQLGMPCAFSCGGEAWCDVGTCIEPVENTTPCTADNQCASLYCQEGVVFEQCADRPVCI